MKIVIDFLTIISTINHLIYCDRMHKYKYSVQVNNKITSGIITASSLEAAKDNLVHLGYEILSIVPLQEQKKDVTKRIFSFEAFNKEGKKILGTIKTVSEENARKKLEESYQLSRISLTEIRPSEEKKEDKKENQEVIEQGKKAIQKAENFLQTISVYDADYNIIFDAKEEIRYNIKDNHLQDLDKKIDALLSSLHEKETTTLLTEKEMEEELVAQKTSDNISMIKSETEHVVQTPYNFYFNAIVKELQILSQWLLCFYALYFVFASLLIEKQTALSGIPFIQNTLTSPLLFKITLSLVWVNVACRIKVYLFENKLASGIFLSVITFFLILYTFLV